MKKGVKSLIIGLSILLFECGAILFMLPRGGPRYPIDIVGISAALLLRFIFAFTVVPLLIFGLIWGLKGLRENINKFFPYAGIITTSIGLILSIYFLLGSPPLEYVKTQKYNMGLLCGGKIQGIFLPKGTKVELYDSKKLKRIELIKGQKIQGIIFPKGTEINFFGSGNIEQIILSSDQIINGIKCSVRSTVRFYYSGKLRSLELAEDREMQGILFPKGTMIDFYESGKIDRAHIDSTHIQLPIAVQGIKCAMEISLFESGKLKYTYLAENKEIQGILFAKDTSIQFYESGKLWCVRLGSDQEIKGRKYYKGRSLKFDEAGNIIEIE